MSFSVFVLGSSERYLWPVQPLGDCSFLAFEMTSGVSAREIRSRACDLLESAVKGTLPAAHPVQCVVHSMLAVEGQAQALYEACVAGCPRLFEQNPDFQKTRSAFEASIEADPAFKQRVMLSYVACMRLQSTFLDDAVLPAVAIVLNRDLAVYKVNVDMNGNFVSMTGVFVAKDGNMPEDFPVDFVNKTVSSAYLERLRGAIFVKCEHVHYEPLMPSPNPHAINGTWGQTDLALDVSVLHLRRKSFFPSGPCFPPYAPERFFPPFFPPWTWCDGFAKPIGLCSYVRAHDSGRTGVVTQLGALNSLNAHVLWFDDVRTTQLVMLPRLKQARISREEMLQIEEADRKERRRLAAKTRFAKRREVARQGRSAEDNFAAAQAASLERRAIEKQRRAKNIREAEERKAQRALSAELKASATQAMQKAKDKPERQRPREPEVEASKDQHATAAQPAASRGAEQPPKQQRLRESDLAASKDQHAIPAQRTASRGAEQRRREKKLRRQQQRQQREQQRLDTQRLEEQQQLEQMLLEEREVDQQRIDKGGQPVRRMGSVQDRLKWRQERQRQEAVVRAVWRESDEEDRLFEREKLRRWLEEEQNQAIQRQLDLDLRKYLRERQARKEHGAGALEESNACGPITLDEFFAQFDDDTYDPLEDETVYQSRHQAALARSYQRRQRQPRRLFMDKHGDVDLHPGQ